MRLSNAAHAAVLAGILFQVSCEVSRAQSPAVGGAHELLAAALPAPAPTNSDVLAYIVARGQGWRQTNASAPALDPGPQPQVLLAFVDPATSSSVTGATLRAPTGQTSTLIRAGSRYALQLGHSSKAVVDAAFPPGPYTFSIQTAHEGLRSATLRLPPDRYPNPPHVLNWEDAQHIDASVPFQFFWNEFGDGTSNDFVYLEIDNVFGDVLFVSPSLLESNRLDGTSPSVSVPTNTFGPREPYTARLLFFRQVDYNTNDYPGVPGIAAYFRETRFALLTTSNAPPEGRFQFDASFYTLAESGGMANVTVRRAGGSLGPASIYLTSMNGSATGGADYAPVGVPADLRLDFANGENARSVMIGALDDFALEGNETFTLLLHSPSGAILGNPSNAVVRILDDEDPLAGTFQFSTDRYSIAETGGVAQITVLRTGGTNGTVSVQAFTGDASAWAGPDYMPVLTNLTFAPGETRQVFFVPINDDTVKETNETLTLFLSNPTSGASLGPLTRASLTILDDEVGVEFSLPTFMNTERVGTAFLTVVRTGRTNGPVRVGYFTHDGTAVSNADYRARSGTLTFAPGVTRQRIGIPILNDTLVEPNESFWVCLTNVIGPKAGLGPRACAELTIVDEDLGGMLNFSATNYSVSETGRFATITVRRLGGRAGGVRVRVDMLDGSATNGVDYIGYTTNLSFAAGATAVSFRVRVLDNALDEPDRSLSLILSEPEGGASLGPRTNTTLTIRDNDVGGVIQFSTNTVRVCEQATVVKAQVVRKAGRAGNVMVDYATSNETALAGIDYTPVAGKLTFGSNETVKTIEVPIIGSDSAAEPVKRAWIVLSAPAGGATLGTLNAAALIIADDEVAGAYSVASSITITGCSNNSDNGTFNLRGEATFADAGDQDFTGQVQLRFSNGRLAFTQELRGRRNCGKLNGTYTYATTDGGCGNGSFTGTLSGNKLKISFSGRGDPACETCNHTGTLSGSRPDPPGAAVAAGH